MLLLAGSAVGEREGARVSSDLPSRPRRPGHEDESEAGGPSPAHHLSPHSKQDSRRVQLRRICGKDPLGLIQ